ncbi:MAG: hypothetical protein J0L88_15340 [Xanthomonadales bacterium]|nr:hypothetical protein [Xanthomonadales bacterium]
MSASRSAPRALPSRIMLAAVMLGAGSAGATDYAVGSGAGCTHATLQAAVTAAQSSSPAADTIRVTTATYNAQEVAINTAQELNIIGGYAACNSAEPTAGSRSILDGSGGNARPVMRIVVPTGGLVRLRNLRLRDGDNGTAGEGGGIYFEGNGRLGLVDTTLSNNIAGYGAGLYARGTGSEASVEFGANVTVLGNTARTSGGGVYVDEVKFTMLEAGSGIYLNEAQGDGGGGYGGGLMMLVDSRDALADIGPGMGSLGAIYNNKAKYGGGVAMVANDDAEIEALLRVHSATATPAGIRNNVASVQGGGLYQLGNGGFFNESYLQAHFWHAELRGNTAPDGAAIYSDGDDAGNSMRFNAESADYVPPPPGVICPAGAFCSGIVDNVAQTSDGTPTAGAVIHLLSGASLYANHAYDNGYLPYRGGMVVEGNRGGTLLFAGTDDFIWLRNALIVDNQASLALVDKEGGGGYFTLQDGTLAGNLVGSGQPVLALAGTDVELRRSILWQPGRTLLQCSGCDKTFESVFASERASLDGGNSTEVVVADPRFVDPGNGDYRLRAASPAVDYGPTIGGDDRDVTALGRDINLPITLGPFNGVRDIGAFERQALQPLVQNSDIEVDTRLWTELVAGSLGRGSFNASGGSGSLSVYKTGVARGQPIAYASQCVHLPGPGRYRLNGWGRTLPDTLYVAPLDSTQLRWELRHAGGEGCNAGAIAASGILPLSNEGWVRPANPAVIDVSASAWTAQSSLLVRLVVIDNSVAPNAAVASGWFDGITLDVEALDDGLFADGFDEN